MTTALAVVFGGCDGGDAPPEPDQFRLTDVQRVEPAWPGLLTGAVWADADTAAVVTLEGGVYRVDLGSGEATELARLDGASDLVADPPSGIVVASAGGGEVVAWDRGGRELSRVEFGFADVSAVAIASGGDRYAAAGADVTVVDTATGAVVVRTGPGPGTVRYNVVAFAGDKVVAAPGPEIALDVWDLAGPRVTSQDCACEAVAASIVFEPDGRYAAIGTLSGRLVLWDTGPGRAAAEQTLTESADQQADPLAVIRGRHVLYDLSSTAAGGTVPDGPLMVWDSQTRTTTELWKCPGECDVRTVSTLPGTDRILFYTATPGGD
ncbi:PQQ-like beta-propeller repeat protein, partial [Micromonospora sp. CPCC 205371]|nr:PQQ-like beta-propeller repeat protein [Micromonospora sp. CPCC 205371]